MEKEEINICDLISVEMSDIIQNTFDNDKLFTDTITGNLSPKERYKLKSRIKRREKSISQISEILDKGVIK